MKRLFIFLPLMALLTLCVGCAVTAPPTHSTLSTTPPELATVGHWLDVLAVLAVVALAGCVTVLFLDPALHTLSLSVGAGSIALELTCLVLKVSLPFIPWIALGGGILALAFLAYEVYENYIKAKPAVVTGTSSLTPAK